MIAFTNQINQCTRILLIFSSILIFLFALDYYFQILPFNGIILFAYLSFVILSSILGATIIIQHVLKLNKPIDCNSKKKYIKRLQDIYNYLFNNNEERKTKESINNIIENNEVFYLIKDKCIDERINEFIQDIKKRFILNWYHQISKDVQFLNETEKLLDEIIRRFLQIVIAVDNKTLIQGILIIILRHIKEFKKATKRCKKNDGCVEDLYRYSHVGSTSQETYEQFICQLTTKLLKQFVSSELWTSLVWRTLVSILSKKLTTTSLMYISQPGYINYMLVNICATESTKKRLQLCKMTYISISDVDLGFKKNKTPKDESKRNYLKAVDNIDGTSTPKISPKKNGASKTVATKTVPSEEVKTKKIEISVPEKKSHVSISSRTVSEPVKIYNSSSEKTWRNSSDLECVSLGEDLLALQEISDPDTQIQSLIEKKLWKDNSDSQEAEEKAHSIFETVLCEEEEVAKDVTISPTNIQAATQLLTNTMKPIGNVTANTIQNMKDFQQSTVNTVNSVVKPISQVTTSAKHKIGDLQDEAAGVMEGIFDFGMAGIRKGLRLTGLHDNLNDLTGKNKSDSKKLDDFLKKQGDFKRTQARRLTKFSQAICEDDTKLEKTSSNESEDNVWINPLTKSSPNFDGQILLEKSPVSDNSNKLEEQKSQEIPSISMDLDLSSSPDLEYEDTTDLATTTAKLRSLLAQKSSESTLTTPAISPMPQDDKAHTPSMEPLLAELTDVDGVMPSLYKFYNKTATGLQHTFNSIKTALPGNEKDEQKTVVDGAKRWQFVADNRKNGLFKRMEKLLAERRDYCIIDPAYDYIEILDQTDGLLNKNDPQFDDDLDEFDIQIPMAKTLLEIFCELLSDTDTCLTQEPVMKCCLVLFGKFIDDELNNGSQILLKNIKNIIKKLPEPTMELPLPMKIEMMINCCFEILPGSVITILGKTTIEKGLNILITSLQSLKINRDIFLQIFELFTTHLVKVNNLMSPTYSA